MKPTIAIVGMAGQYPDASTPAELWENVLAQRQAFRRLPPERLNLDDYWSSEASAADHTYCNRAAVIKDYTFDRVKFRVSGRTFRSVDLTHWLALDVASQALVDAGFTNGTTLPRARTGVVVGNSLTGEFSRANIMRLRWPYVRRSLDAVLVEEGWPPEKRRPFLERLEHQYKAPFPPVGTETLAGGLSNTIAGRICNYFDLKGGGYTVDGACASSLLSVITACSTVAAGDWDVALAGGVDLSLDPFELVGFARVGALARKKMRVYDKRSEGFWPGEGCGFVVLMKLDEAVRQNRKVYAVIRGWGVSSDGSGGITRPEVDGQLLAVRRAWNRAELSIATAALFEGHGTGTPVGDTTELCVLTQERRESNRTRSPAALGSIKANIGHTKAAAGIAGLLKTSLALHHQILPPTTGCTEPHTELTARAPELRVLSAGEPWPAGQPLRAGVSAMGFGGINTHVVLEGRAVERPAALTTHDRTLTTSPQDAELFLLSAESVSEVRERVNRLYVLAPNLALSEMADLAAYLATIPTTGPVRLAVVASTPGELTGRLHAVAEHLNAGHGAIHEPGVYFGSSDTPPRIGFLFPGQGTAVSLDGGLLCRRFTEIQALYETVDFPVHSGDMATDVAQPAITTASMAVLQLLQRLGISGCTAVGHSLGELTALHWAGAIESEELQRLAEARGRAMANLAASTGAMAALNTDAATVETLIEDSPVVVAALNGPEQTVVSGEKSGVAAVADRARKAGIGARRLRVSHAFHSPLVAASADSLETYLRGHPLRQMRRPIVSTVTGRPLTAEDDLAPILVEQVTAPVRFTEAIAEAASDVDLWVEVGPGKMLSGLVRRMKQGPVVATEGDGSSVKGLLRAIGAAFVFGVPVCSEKLFEDRFIRPFNPDRQPEFFANPCERAPALASAPPATTAEVVPPGAGSETDHELAPRETGGNDGEDDARRSPIEVVRELVARRAELPLKTVRDRDRMLSDLHLNSITVSELVNEAGRRLGVSPSATPTNYADSTLLDVADALGEQKRLGENAVGIEEPRVPDGLDTWVRPFTVEFVEQPRPAVDRTEATGSWRILAPPDHPLKERLQRRFKDAGGSGVVVALPPGPSEKCLDLLLEGAQIVMGEDEACHFVLVQTGGGAAAFARTVHLELPHVTGCVVDVPFDHRDALAWVAAEIRAASDFVEVRYDESGVRRIPRMRVLPLSDEAGDLPLGSDDVLLVSGGGKGITAECALMLGRETRARLVLLGRSRVEEDSELAHTLERMEAEGVRFRYFRADVTDPEAIRRVIETAEDEWGPITAVVHGAARNHPRPLQDLTIDDVHKTLAPKIEGLQNILAAVDPRHLHLLVTFGSIIGRMGLPMEADYALANEWLAHRTGDWQRRHPHCRCLTVEWSIWSSIGMGARLGSVDALAKRGVAPISPEAGVRMLQRLLARPLPATAVVVTGRFGSPPTLRLDDADLPFLRYLEQPRVFYPGVELIVDAELSAGTDPYVNDHVVQGERLFPAVLGLEAMTQAAQALVHASTIPDFEDVVFRRPIVVPPDGSITIRVAALVRTSDAVEVVVRSETTAFQTDHFRALCRFRKLKLKRTLPIAEVVDSQAVEIKPAGDLYGHILFQRGRFKRLKDYRRLQATACTATISTTDDTPWFVRYLPADLVMGDPGARDAAIHAIQACIPHATLIPTGVHRLLIRSGKPDGEQFVRAREHHHSGDTFVYDVERFDAEGRVFEQWKGLRLRLLERNATGAAWVPALLAPYVERWLGEWIPDADLSVGILQDARIKRERRSNRAIQQVLSAPALVQRRSDGKPEMPGPRDVSVAHAGPLTLAVVGSRPIGCDVEPVRRRAKGVWQDLLNPDRYELGRLIARETGEAFEAACTRVWTSIECLKKCGAPAAPLVLENTYDDGWVTLTAGKRHVATVRVTVRTWESPLILAVLTGSSKEPLEPPGLLSAATRGSPSPADGKNDVNKHSANRHTDG